MNETLQEHQQRDRDIAAEPPNIPLEQAAITNMLSAEYVQIQREEVLRQKLQCEAKIRELTASIQHLTVQVHRYDGGILTLDFLLAALQ